MLREHVRAQLAAVQAIDVGFREAGKVIVIARVAGRDIVKVIDVKPGWTMTEYRDLVRRVEALYGVSPRWVDAGPFREGEELIKHGR